MLNAQSIQNIKEIEAQQKDIDIILDDENLFQLAFELPSAVELRANHCKPIQHISITELSAQDPFNLKELLHNEFMNLSRKRDRFKDSTLFALKLASAASLPDEFTKAENILSESFEKKYDSRLLHKLGDVLILQGRNDEALRMFERTNLNEDIYSNLRIAYILTKNNDLANAYKYLETAQRIDPCDFRTQMFMGVLQLNTGQCEKAIRSFRVATISKKDSSALHVNLAASHWSLGHSSKAIMELRKAIAINPLNENALIFYSDVMYELKDNQKAILPLEYYVKLNQQSKLAWERVARAYYFTEKYTKAKVALENQLRIADEPYVYNNLGLVCWQLNERKTAIKYLSEAIEKSQNDNKQLSIPLLNLAILLNEKKHFKVSYGLLKDFIKKENENLDDRILAKMAIQYFVSLEGLEHTDSIITELRSFLSRPYKDIEGRTILLIYKIYYDAVIAKNYRGCIDTTDTLLALLANYGNEISEDSKWLAYNNIAFYYLLFNEPVKAQHFIDKIKKYVNKNTFCTATYGLYNIKKGNLEKGINLYEVAISLAKTRDIKDKIRQRLNYELAKHYISDNNTRDAIRYLNKAIKETNGYKYVTREATDLLKTIQ